jgi:integrase
MPKKLPHLQREVTRHGKVIWYVRVQRGPRIRVDGEFGTPEFHAAYRDALANGAPAKIKTVVAERGSYAAFIKEYMASPSWAALAKETRKQFSYQLARVADTAGDIPFRSATKAKIVEGRDRRRHKPTDANKFVKAMRKLFAFAVARDYMTANPADGIELIPLPNKRIGFHTWSEDEIERYEARWPVGSRERLALDLLLFTGLRRSDAVRLGRQHIKDGIATIRTEKTGEPVVIPVLPPLAASINASPTGDLAFIATSRGKPFSKESFGVWFKRACMAAGVPGSAHGLRKAGAVRAAEAGATEAQLNALFGWREGSRESSTYTRKARRTVLAKDAAKLLILPNLSGVEKSAGKSASKSLKNKDAK